MPIGLTFPLAKTTSSLGYLAFTVTELEAAYANLKALLVTNWGERPNHFYHGCNLIEFLFNQSEEETKEKIIARIESQVTTWLPYISLDSIDLEYTPEMNRISVKIGFSLKGRPDQFQSLEVSVG